MSFFHHSRTSKSPIIRKLSRKQPPNHDAQETEEHNESSNDSSVAQSQSSEERSETVEDSAVLQQQQPASFRENDNFKPKQVAEGSGAFANGPAQHEISSKQDYELCKEQVEKGQSKQEVLEHFKLVKDLKPLDAPDSMDDAIDHTKNPAK